MLSKRIVMIGLVLTVAFAASAAAQWRGLGRVTGKVVDDTGAAMMDVTIRADLPGVGGTTVKSDEKGEWTVNGIARGEWIITVAKDGMVAQKIKVAVQEMAAAATVKTTMKKE